LDILDKIVSSAGKKKVLRYFSVYTAIQQSHCTPKGLVPHCEDRSQTTSLGDSVSLAQTKIIEFMQCYLFATEAAYICSITLDQTGSVYN